MFAWILNIGRALPYDERPQIKTNYILTIDMPTSNEDKKSPSLLSRAIEKNYAKSKNHAANRSQQQGQNRVANRKTQGPLVKLIRNFPSTKSEKLPVRPSPSVPSRHDIRPLTSGHDHRPSTSGHDHRPSAIQQQPRGKSFCLNPIPIKRVANPS